MKKVPAKSKIDVFFEKLPPIFGLILISIPFFLSFINPEVASVFIIVLNVFFLYKSIALSIQFSISLLKMREAQQINWLEKVQGLKNIDAELIKINNDIEEISDLSLENVKTAENTTKFVYPDKILNNTKRLPKFLQKIIFYREKKKTLRFLNKERVLLEIYKKRNILSPDEIRHVVIVPHAKEPFGVLKETMDNLTKQTFPSKQITVILGAEAADPEGLDKSLQLQKEYEKYFEKIIVTNHVLQPGELVGKSSNMAWAGAKAGEIIRDLGWDFEKVTLTSCDADSKLPDNYFAYVTYMYLTVPDSKYKFFNGAMVFYNNIWRLPFYARVKNSMSSIYNVARMARTDKLFPFSTYTTSYWMIDQIGYWDPWVTPEDFHLFFKSLFKFQNKVETVPLFIKIMSDAAEGKTHWDTIRNNYKQERRWSWGVSDDGWVIRTLVRNWRELSLKVKYMSMHVLFDHVIGIASGIIIMIGGNLPPLIDEWFLDQGFRNSVFGVRLPGVSATIIRMTTIFLIIVIFLDFYLKPRPTYNPWWRKFTRLLEWVSLPIASFVLSVLPGVEAHTRLLFGRYLEYYVTKKYHPENKK